MGYYSLYICTIAMLGLSVMTGAQAAQPVSGELASKPSNKLSSPLTAAQTIKGPGTIVVPRQSCGTHWTGYVDDPGLADTHTYEWDFGDSNTATGSLTVTVKPINTAARVTATRIPTVFSKRCRVCCDWRCALLWR